jgi:hypothetical protein
LKLKDGGLSQALIAFCALLRHWLGQAGPVKFTSHFPEAQRLPSVK